MRNLKKVLLSLGAAAAVAALATGGTFAGFTAQDTVTGNDFDSGTVVVDLSNGSTGPVFSVADMVIGDTKSGTIKVSNDGANKASYVLKGSATGSEALAQAVQIVIKDPSDAVVYSGSLDGFNDTAAGFNLDALAPSTSRTYSVEVSLPAQANETADNALQNLAGSETFSVKATQRDGIDRDTDTTPEGL